MFKIIKSLLFLCLLTFIIPIANGQQSEPEREIEKVVESLNDAMVHLNKRTLKKLASEELSYGHSSGLVQNKSEFIDGVMNDSFRFQTIEISNQTIQIVDDVAIVRHVLDSDFQNGQVSGHLQLGIILIWKKESKKWKLLARQAFKL